MMLYFRYGGDMIVVNIDGTNVFFGTTSLGVMKFSSIEGIRLSKEGIIKEHPDLEGKDDGFIRKEGVRRFKEHIKKLGNVNRIKDYIIKELEQHGYQIQYVRRDGFRPEKVK